MIKFSRVLKLGSHGDDVILLQESLKNKNFFGGKSDGLFGTRLKESVKKAQKFYNLDINGDVNLVSWNKITGEDYIQEIKSDTDLLKKSVTSHDGLVIYDKFISESDYIQEETKKDTIWLHHTSTGSRPDKVINKYKNNRGEGTNFLIGRKSSSTDDNTYDGLILKLFEDKYWVNHLDISHPDFKLLNSTSISISLCNYGYLKLDEDGNFYNIIGKPIKKEEVCELDTPFRGYKYYEKYTNKQIESLKILIQFLSKKHKIDIVKGVYSREWFEYNENFFSRGGLRSYTQVNHYVYDLFPQPELIQMLNSL